MITCLFCQALRDHIQTVSITTNFTSICANVYRIFLSYFIIAIMDFNTGGSISLLGESLVLNSLCLCFLQH